MDGKAGRLRSHTVCGILMQSSLAVTIEGVPLGFRTSRSLSSWRLPAVGISHAAMVGLSHFSVDPLISAGGNREAYLQPLKAKPLQEIVLLTGVDHVATQVGRIGMLAE